MSYHITRSNKSLSRYHIRHAQECNGPTRATQTAANHGLVIVSDTVFHRPINTAVIALYTIGTLTTAAMIVADRTRDAMPSTAGRSTHSTSRVRAAATRRTCSN
jgi:hypothetical protein